MGSGKYSRSRYLAQQNKYRPGWFTHGLVRIDFFSTPVVEQVLILTPTSYYVVDYYFPEYGVVLELDGGYHSPSKDSVRDEYLRSLGLEVLRLAAADSWDPNYLLDELIKVRDSLMTREVRNLVIDFSNTQVRVVESSLDSPCNRTSVKLQSLIDYDSSIKEYLDSDRLTPLHLGWWSTRKMKSVFGEIKDCTISDYTATIQLLHKYNIHINLYSYRSKYPKVVNNADGRKYEIFESEVDDYLSKGWTFYKGINTYKL